MLVMTPCDAGVQAACRRERVMFYMLRLCIFHASAATCNVGLLVHVFPPQADTCCACDVQRAAFRQQWASDEWGARARCYGRYEGRE